MLKETRSTFRKYQASLRRARSRSRGDEASPEPEARSVRAASRGRAGRVELDWVRLSASALVRTAAAQKARAGPADAHKLVRGLAEAGGARPATDQTGKIGS